MTVENVYGGDSNGLGARALKKVKAARRAGQSGGKGAKNGPQSRCFLPPFHRNKDLCGQAAIGVEPDSHAFLALPGIGAGELDHGWFQICLVGYA
jgi:hypothetical protein